MSRRGSHQERKTRTRAALLDAAHELFEADGYLAATVDGIAARAGYTKGAFYGHFKDKADAFNTVLDERTEASFAALDRTLDAAGADGALELVLAWLADSFERPFLERAQAEFYATAINDPDERARLAARVAAMRQTVIEMIDRYCEDAGVRLPVGTPDLAAMIMAYTEGATRLQRLSLPGLSPTLVRDGLIYLWGGAMAGSPE